MNLFENGPLYPILATIFSSILYSGLFNFGYNRIIEKMYAYYSGSMTFKVQFYIYLLNIPAILLIFTGVIYNGCLLPLDVALKADEFYILIVSSYICYLQESRHTPIRGFVVIKDTIIILVLLILYINLNTREEQMTTYIATTIVVYLFSLIIQSFTNELQSWLLLTLKIRQKNIYRAAFLLTQKSQPPNFLQIKDIISQHEQLIKEEIEDFAAVASGLKQSNQDLLILTNFAKLFIPIKKAYEIHQEMAKQRSEDQFVENWKEMEKDLVNNIDNCQEEEEPDKNHSFNQSASTLLIKKTITTDSYFDNDDIMERKDQDESIVFKIIKYICYPLYLTTKITGRCRYFMDYLIFFLLVATMFVFANAISFFSTTFPSNQSFVSLIFGVLLIYPISSYFIRISQGSNDYDFLGIFMQGVISKYVILGIAFLIRGIFFQQISFNGNSTILMCLLVRIGTYLTLMAFLVWKRFAMRYSNFKIFLGILITSELIKIIGQFAIPQTN